MKVCSLQLCDYALYTFEHHKYLSARQKVYRARTGCNRRHLRGVDLAREEVASGVDAAGEAKAGGRPYVLGRLVTQLRKSLHASIHPSSMRLIRALSLSENADRTDMGHCKRRHRLQDTI